MWFPGYNAVVRGRHEHTATTTSLSRGSNMSVCMPHDHTNAKGETTAHFLLSENVCSLCSLAERGWRGAWLALCGHVCPTTPSSCPVRVTWRLVQPEILGGLIHYSLSGMGPCQHPPRIGRGEARDQEIFLSTSENTLNAHRMRVCCALQGVLGPYHSCFRSQAYMPSTPWFESCVHFGQPRSY